MCKNFLILLHQVGNSNYFFACAKNKITRGVYNDAPPDPVAVPMTALVPGGAATVNDRWMDHPNDEYQQLRQHDDRNYDDHINPFLFVDEYVTRSSSSERPVTTRTRRPMDHYDFFTRGDNDGDDDEGVPALGGDDQENVVPRRQLLDVLPNHDVVHGDLLDYVMRNKRVVQRQVSDHGDEEEVVREVDHMSTAAVLNHSHDDHASASNFCSGAVTPSSVASMMGHNSDSITSDHSIGHFCCSDDVRGRPDPIGGGLTSSDDMMEACDRIRPFANAYPLSVDNHVMRHPERRVRGVVPSDSWTSSGEPSSEDGSSRVASSGTDLSSDDLRVMCRVRQPHSCLVSGYNSSESSAGTEKKSTDQQDKNRGQEQNTVDGRETLTKSPRKNMLISGGCFKAVSSNARITLEAHAQKNRHHEDHFPAARATTRINDNGKKKTTEQITKEELPAAQPSIIWHDMLLHQYFINTDSRALGNLWAKQIIVDAENQETQNCRRGVMDATSSNNCDDKTSALADAFLREVPAAVRDETYLRFREFIEKAICDRKTHDLLDPTLKRNVALLSQSTSSLQVDFGSITRVEDRRLHRKHTEANLADKKASFSIATLAAGHTVVNSVKKWQTMHLHDSGFDYHGSRGTLSPTSEEKDSSSNDDFFRARGTRFFSAVYGEVVADLVYHTYLSRSEAGWFPEGGLMDPAEEEDKLFALGAEARTFRGCEAAELSSELANNKKNSHDHETVATFEKQREIFLGMDAESRLELQNIQELLHVAMAFRKVVLHCFFITIQTQQETITTSAAMLGENFLASLKVFKERIVTTHDSTSHDNVVCDEGGNMQMSSWDKIFAGKVLGEIESYRTSHQREKDHDFEFHEDSWDVWLQKVFPREHWMTLRSALVHLGVASFPVDEEHMEEHQEFLRQERVKEAIAHQIAPPNPAFRVRPDNLVENLFECANSQTSCSSSAGEWAEPVYSTYYSKKRGGPQKIRRNQECGPDRRTQECSNGMSSTAASSGKRIVCADDHIFTS